LVSKEKNGAIKRPPVTIMVTAQSKDNLLKEAKSQILDGILIKPVTPSALFCTLSLKCNLDLDKQIPSSMANIKKCAQLLKDSYVLLVEDNELNQEVAVGILDKFGIKSKVANHGLEALMMVKDEDFDCILMDMHMPVMDGIEATKAIKSMESKNSIPIIAMTAAATEDDRRVCLEAGMDEHISKPISVDVLIKALLRATKNAETTIESILEPTKEDIAADNIIDINQIKNRFLMGHDEAVALALSFASSFRSFEQELNSALAANDILSAKELIHKIKGASGNVAANRLFTLSGKLEKELSDKDDYAHTLEEFGYCLNSTLEYITNNFKNSDTNPTATSSLEEVRTQLEVLKSKLKSSELIDFEQKEAIFEPIRSYTFKKLELQKLEKAVDNFEHKVAIGIIDKMLIELESK
jgi:CheY-like chemotaxis protein/HPt (histidine-containing phosphotransfer) domain-containing protein